MPRPPHQPPLEYASPGDPDAPADAAGRSFVKWMQLLVVWVVGLGVWMIYLAAIIYIFFRYIA